MPRVGPPIAGKRVVAVEDGPTLTHGGMTYGAGVVAARRFGAARLVDPRPAAVGSIAEVLEMTVAEALEFFGPVPTVAAKLRTLNDVGLGYIHLGQPATTLSGGEAQRVKLATELSKRATGKTFYVLDEPTTGLHFEDVRVLLDVLHALVQRGNTVIVIEHHLDVIAAADWILDLGPEGGEDGGRIVAQGPPELVARNKKSYTGQALAAFFSRARRGAPV